MNSTSKFAKYFYRLINEDVGTGALGDGSSVRGGIYTANDPNSKDGYNTGSAVIAKPLGKEKKRVQKRMFPENEEGVDPGIENQHLLHRSERAALRRGVQLPELPVVNNIDEAINTLTSAGSRFGGPEGSAVTGENNAVKWVTRVLMYNNIEVPDSATIKSMLPGSSTNLIRRSLEVDGLKKEDNQVKQKFSDKYAKEVEKEFEDHVRLRSPDGKLGVKLPPGNKKEIEDYKKKGYKEEEAEDRCKRKADSVYGNKTSAYKSGAIVRCRKGKIWKKK